METKKKSIWLNYDLGLNGNYNALFTFLDNYKAKECGNGLAYFEVDNIDDQSINHLIDKIKLELSNVIKSNSDRIYVIWRNDNGHNVHGKFLFGDRKTPAWNGYGTLGDNNQMDGNN